MISKELLSEVLDDLNEGWGILDHYTDKNEVCISYVKDNIEFDEEIINIHELAHKVKEWAMSQEYTIKSIATHYYSGVAYTEIYHPSTIIDPINITEADTEPEAIFKAGQYILEIK